jgi:hypothetical protein
MPGHVRAEWTSRDLMYSETLTAGNLCPRNASPDTHTRLDLLICAAPDPLCCTMDPLWPPRKVITWRLAPLYFGYVSFLLDCCVPLYTSLSCRWCSDVVHHVKHRAPSSFLLLWNAVSVNVFFWYGCFITQSYLTLTLTKHVPTERAI